ncbi:translation initiation factor IF-2 [Myotis myotis]|uniref:translation initiation factor IF-2 n=1 Tax=Myotis myotis TaxID=51298 RepID=UPI00174C1FDE|nr:translation initiation factor IF-2 [Myotis myotis]
MPFPGQGGPARPQRRSEDTPAPGTGGARPARPRLARRGEPPAPAPRAHRREQPRAAAAGTGHRRARVGAGRGPRAGWRRLLAPRAPRYLSAKVTAPRRLAPGRAASAGGEAGPLHHTRPRRSGDRHPRRRRAQAAPSPAAASSAPAAARGPPSARPAQTPARARACEEAVTWRPAAGGGGRLGSARQDHAARPPRRPTFRPGGDLPAFSHTPPAPVCAPLKAWRSSDLEQDLT